jgi:hypothetical protein
VADLSVKEPLGPVGHLVDERVNALAPVSLEHEVHVQREFQDIAYSVPHTGYHLADSRRHPIAEAERNLIRKPPVESRAIQIAIESAEVDALLRSSATRSRLIEATPTPLVSLLNGISPQPMLASHATQLELESVPTPHLLRRRTVRRRPLTRLSGDDGEVIHQLERSCAVRNVQVEHGATLRERPDRAAVRAKANAAKAASTTTMKEREHLFFASCRHSCPPHRVHRKVNAPLGKCA